MTGKWHSHGTDYVLGLFCLYVNVYLNVTDWIVTKDKLDASYYTLKVCYHELKQFC